MAKLQSSAPRKRITIVDVARHANVSTTAVSKVLRNAYGASPAMRARVRHAIEELLERIGDRERRSTFVKLSPTLVVRR